MMATASRKPGADNSSSALSSSAQVKIRVGSSYRELACVFTLIFLPVIIFLIHSSSPAPSDPISLQRVEKIEDDPVLPFCEPPLHFLTEHSLLDCAARKARLHERNSRNVANKGKPGPQRLAFCFLSRGHLPHEHLWRRFFHGQEELHSIYVHTHPSFQFPNTSLFYGHQVPSEKVERMSISLVDAMRRLMAYAVLDPEHGSTNSWFIFACEVTIPIRSFSYTYDYLTKSRHSFVESFAPVSRYYSWETLPEFERWRLRKGEVWMALQRRHAAMILGDWSIYFKFRSQCTFGCNPDESYVQTFLALVDPGGIANRTVMYVDWTGIHISSPKTFEDRHMSPQWVQDIQGRRADGDGQYHDTSLDMEVRNLSRITRTCYYNGVPNSACFLFVRKVGPRASPLLGNFTQSILGY